MAIVGTIEIWINRGKFESIKWKKIMKEPIDEWLDAIMGGWIVQCGHNAN